MIGQSRGLVERRMRKIYDDKIVLKEISLDESGVRGIEFITTLKQPFSICNLKAFKQIELENIILFIFNFH